MKTRPTKAEERERNPEAFLEKRRRERQRYRERTGTTPDGNLHHKAYSERELEMIISSEYSDRELAVLMNRSVIAIQNKRARMRKKGYYIKYKGETK